MNPTARKLVKLLAWTAGLAAAAAGTWWLCRDAFSWWSLLTIIATMVCAFMLADTVLNGRFVRDVEEAAERDKERKAERIPFAVELGCHVGTSGYQSSSDTGFGKVLDTLSGSSYASWKDHYRVGTHTVHATRGGSTTTHVRCGNCGQSVDVSVDRVMLTYEGRTGDGKHKVMSAPKPRGGSADADPLRPGQSVLALLVLVFLGLVVWHGWGLVRDVNTRRRVKSAADEFLADLGARRRPPPDSRSAALDWPNLLIMAESLQLPPEPSSDWDKTSVNEDRSACDLAGSVQSRDGRTVPVSFKLAYQNDRWEIRSVSFPELSPDFLKERAVAETRRLADAVLASAGVGLDGAAFQPGDVAGVLTALQLYDPVSTEWKAPEFDSTTNTCTLTGVAKLKDGRDVPVSIQVRRHTHDWRVASFSSPLPRSEMPRDYAVARAKDVATAFLKQIARDLAAHGAGASPSGGPGGPSPGPGGAGTGGPGGSGAAGSGGAAASGAIEPGAAGADGPSDRNWTTYWTFQPGGGPEAIDQVASWFRNLQFGNFQSVSWNDAEYHSETMTCTVRGVVTLKDGKTVPLSLGVRYTIHQLEPSRKAWYIEGVGSP